MIIVLPCDSFTDKDGSSKVADVENYVKDNVGDSWQLENSV